MEPEELYHHVGRLLETVPAAGGAAAIPPELAKWVGRATAVIDEHGTPRDKGYLITAMAGLTQAPSRFEALETIKLALFNILGAAELDAPPGERGAFIPVGNSFDFFAALVKIFQPARRDVFIIDPYMDESALTEFGTTVPAGVMLRLLSDEKDHKASLPVAAKKWVAQHSNARPLAVRLAPPRSLHDRAIFVDGAGAWTLTQSFKDFANRSPGEIIRANDIAALKIAAYEDIWSRSKSVV